MESIAPLGSPSASVSFPLASPPDLSRSQVLQSEGSARSSRSLKSLTVRSGLLEPFKAPSAWAAESPRRRPCRGKDGYSRGNSKDSHFRVKGHARSPGLSTLETQDDRLEEMWTVFDRLEQTCTTGRGHGDEVKLVKQLFMIMSDMERRLQQEEECISVSRALRLRYLTPWVWRGHDLHELWMSSACFSAWRLVLLRTVKGQLEDSDIFAKRSQQRLDKREDQLHGLHLFGEKRHSQLEARKLLAAWHGWARGHHRADSISRRVVLAGDWAEAAGHTGQLALMFSQWQRHTTARARTTATRRLEHQQQGLQERLEGSSTMTTALQVELESLRHENMALRKICDDARRAIDLWQDFCHGLPESSSSSATHAASLDERGGWQLALLQQEQQDILSELKQIQQRGDRVDQLLIDGASFSKAGQTTGLAKGLLPGDQAALELERKQLQQRKHRLDRALVEARSICSSASPEEGLKEGIRRVHGLFEDRLGGERRLGAELRRSLEAAEVRAVRQGIDFEAERRSFRAELRTQQVAATSEMEALRQGQAQLQQELHEAQAWVSHLDGVHRSREELSTALSAEGRQLHQIQQAIHDLAGVSSEFLGPRRLQQEASPAASSVPTPGRSSASPNAERTVVPHPQLRCGPEVQVLPASPLSAGQRTPLTVSATRILVAPRSPSPMLRSPSPTARHWI